MTDLEGVGAAGLGASAVGALRTFAYWLANGSVGQGCLEGVDYWTVMRDEPSLLERAVAIFANTLRFDAHGLPLNARAAELRAAHYIRQYVTGETAVPGFEFDEVELHASFGGSPG